MMAEDWVWSEERMALEIAAITIMVMFCAFLYKVCHISTNAGGPVTSNADLEEALHGADISREDAQVQPDRRVIEEA
tara:strand:+ start:18458 stop:18688 length:231 start_codon:yes stop_codon:yes gene_type:complete